MPTHYFECNLFPVITRYPKSVNKHSKALTKTHICYGIFHGKATLTYECLTFVDKILWNVNRKGKTCQCQKSCKIGGVKACQDGDKYPPRRKGNTN